MRKGKHGKIALTPTQLRAIDEKKVTYGARCTWWGPLAYTKTVHATVGISHAAIPVCPECGGPLFEIATEDLWWKSVALYEAGPPVTDRPHAGYVEFMKWMYRRCFTSILVGAGVYHAMTGQTVDITVEDFEADEKAQAEEIIEEGERVARIAEEILGTPEPPDDATWH